MRAQLWPIVLLLVGIAAVAALLTLAALTRTFTPSWLIDGGTFLKHVDQALVAYARDHGGCLPKSLRSLYPRYIADQRVREPVAVFGSRSMSITYWPTGIGAVRGRSYTAAVLLVGPLDRGYDRCGLILWKDGSVSPVSYEDIAWDMYRKLGCSKCW